MLFVTDTLDFIRKNISEYFLNMILLITNVLIGFYTHSYSIMFSSLIAITVCTYLYDANRASINMKLMDAIIIGSILFPIGFMWFQNTHPNRAYAGFIILWAISLIIINEYIGVKTIINKVSTSTKEAIPIIAQPTDMITTVINFLASYGHFVFNIEWALLVLL